MVIIRDIVGKTANEMNREAMTVHEIVPCTSESEDSTPGRVERAFEGSVYERLTEV